MTETYENDDHFDIVYIVIVWFAFLPTLVVPWFIAHWLLIGALAKGRSYLNNGSSAASQMAQSGNGHQQPLQPPRRPSRFVVDAPVPSITCTRPNTNGVETIMVHELGHRRTSEHPTPGKIPKRPRAKSTCEATMLNIDVLNQVMYLASSSLPPLTFLTSEDAAHCVNISSRVRGIPPEILSRLDR